MNDLGAKILTVMEKSHLGRMSVYVLSKQSKDIDLDLDSITQKDVLQLVEQLRNVLPFFLGDSAKDLLINIRRLGENGGAVV